jgi:hypothetical protein
MEKSKTIEQAKIAEQNRSNSRNSDTQTSEDEGINLSFPNENYFCNRNRYEPTSYSINCMASDGRNIMYSTIEDPQYDITAYCYLDVKSDNYRQVDPCRPSLLSRIVDMIWWNSIDKFVCATGNGILTVEYINTRFKILTVINDRWSDVRVAANTNSIWVHERGKIMVYDINFRLVRSMNFEIPCIITRESFCITDNLVAVIVIRGDRTHSDTLQVQFYDFNMIRMRSFDLGSGKVPCMIRTDGTDRFFITDGKSMFYILSSKDDNRTIDLGKEASCLALVNRGSIVLTKSRSELELVKC